MWKIKIRNLLFRQWSSDEVSFLNSPSNLISPLGSTKLLLINRINFHSSQHTCLMVSLLLFWKLFVFALIFRLIIWLNSSFFVSLNRFPSSLNRPALSLVSWSTDRCRLHNSLKSQHSNVCVWLIHSIVLGLEPTTFSICCGYSR